MAKPLVGVIVGSRSDFNIMKRGLEALRVMGVPYEFEMASPHRTPERLTRYAQEAQARGLLVLVCAGGGSAPIASILASHTTLPVVAVPIDSTPLHGQDALFSMVQTPPGIPVATVGINNGENAALLATQIVATKHERFRTVLAHRRAQFTQKLERAAKELLSEYGDLCDTARTAPAHAAEERADDDTDPGSEDVTPEPANQNRTDPIRPGARLAQRGTGGGMAVGLLDTPMPQEPGTVTEGGSEDDFAPMPPRRDGFPPPPSDVDLSPASPVGGSPTLAPITASPAVTESETPPEKEPQRVDTKIFELDPASPDEDVLSHAMMVLLEGGIVAFPTDTVYGLAVDAMNPEAVRRLYEVKGQAAQRKSLSVLIDSPDVLDTLVREVPPALENVIEKYWPGGLTILFLKHPSVLASVSDSNSIAIRIPDNPIPMGLMRMLQRPLAVINASLGDSPAAINARAVIDRFDGRIHCVLDAGPCSSAAMSTVLSVLSDPFEVIREGAVPAEELRQILGRKLKG